jgi:hypothetical protein
MREEQPKQQRDSSKTYRDDIYLMLPLADHKENHRLDDLLAGDDEEDREQELERQMPQIPQKLIANLRELISYECDNLVKKELKIRYMGSFTFLHTTDVYDEPDLSRCTEETREGQTADPADTYCHPTEDVLTDKDFQKVRSVFGQNLTDEEAILHMTTPKMAEDIIAEVTGHVILCAHPLTHMYVLTIMFEDYPQSTSQLLDQMSYRYLKILKPGNEKLAIPFYYYLLGTYGLHRCGTEKALVCLSEKPRDPLEFENILVAEAKESESVDYQIQSDKVKEIAAKNLSQYNDYEVYISEKVICYIFINYPSQMEDRLERYTTYIFVVILVMFQNTAVAKMNTKVTTALSNDGDISLESMLDLEQEYGMTIRFWQVNNFKYLGAQLEADQIMEAFGQEKLKQTYSEHQEFLKNIMDLKTAQNQEKNDRILNFLATLLAILQVQEFAVTQISKFYAYVGVETESAITTLAEHTFNTSVIGGALVVIFLFLILQRQKSRRQKRKLMKK